MWHLTTNAEALAPQWLRTPPQPRRRDRHGLLGVVLVDLLLGRVRVVQWPQAAGEVGGQQEEVRLSRLRP